MTLTPDDLDRIQALIDAAPSTGEGFPQPIVAGQNLLIPAVQSPNFVHNSAGWQLSKTGSAEFQNIIARGNITANSISNTPIGTSPISGSDFSSGTIETTVITFDASGGVLLIYASVLTTVTLTSSQTWTSPANMPATGKVECWAGGGGGARGVDNFSVVRGDGGGGSEYAAEPSFAFLPNTGYTATVGSGGAGGTGASGIGVDGGTTQFGNSPFVTANGGRGGNVQIGNPGGTGSTNTTHFNGGSGSTNGPPTGGGGGGGAGSSGAGGNGSVPGGGAAGSGGGGAGGAGGNTTPTAGSAGSIPGGAGGGGGWNTGTGTSGNGGAGARGQIKISYLTSSALIGAIAPAAGTDSLSNAYGQGFTGQITAIQPASSPTVVETWHSLGAYTSGTTTRAQYRLTAEGELEIDINLTGTPAVGAGSFANTMPAAYRPAVTKRLVIAQGGTLGLCTINTTGTVTMSIGAGGSTTADVCGRLALN